MKRKNPRALDPLRAMPPEARSQAIQQMLADLFGEEVAARVWEQFGPALATTARQPGDHKDPAKNHWRGAWRIHEID